MTARNANMFASSLPESSHLILIFLFFFFKLFQYWAVVLDKNLHLLAL